MGNFLIILGFLVICSAPFSVYASELLGRISTDPAANSGTVVVGTEPADSAEVVRGGTPAVSAAMPAVAGRLLTGPTVQPPALADLSAKILGQKIYPYNSLVRDETERIFLIQGQVKKPIRNLLELEKYRGQTIFSAAAIDLNSYQTRGHLDGELIRRKKDVKVYALKKGLKYHILNLVELARGYFGLPINNLEPEEMKNYL